MRDLFKNGQRSCQASKPDVCLTKTVEEAITSTL